MDFNGALPYAVFVVQLFRFDGAAIVQNTLAEIANANGIDLSVFVDELQRRVWSLCKWEAERTLPITLLTAFTSMIRLALFSTVLADCASRLPWLYILRSAPWVVLAFETIPDCGRYPFLR